MIAVEILVDKLKADVDETKGNLHDTSAYITTERTTKKLEQLTSKIVDIENILKDLKDEKAEQSCSKFHYEEQTLRKMITVEILVDKLKADVDETKGNLHDTLAYITTERTESTKMLKQITSRIVDIENIPKDLKDEKDKAEIIFFSARGIKNSSPAIKETLVFPSVMSTNGSAYDKSTGIFTAPVGGLYMFNLHLCINRDKYLYFEIVANDIVIFKGLGLDDTSKWSTCHSYSTSTVLKAFDKVAVQAARTNGDALWENFETWNMFNGFLILKY